ncbi:MAG: 6-phosphofructokinase [Anaerolineae bacterium]|jgi:6-phosphofructokinase 1|nr:6-phosphofructokinase [Anaerolineae bacterium]
MSNSLIVVSGGDAPGINMAIAQYVRLATAAGQQVYGALGGFPAVLDNALRPLTPADCLPWLGQPGSLLPSSRDPVLAQTDAPDHLRQVLRERGIDRLLLFGGNGTLRHVLPLLAAWGLRCIGLPATIDNDIPGTELTLGFDSACQYASATLDGIRATAHALPGRLFMVETLGGHCGNLALAVAEAAAAHAVILPEYAYSLDWLAQRLKSTVEREGYALLIVGEFAAGARTLAETLPAMTGIRMRDVRLGHAQRGATPSHADRVLAGRLAATAWQALHAGTMHGVAVVRGGVVQLHPGPLPDTAVPPPDAALYSRINGLE